MCLGAEQLHTLSSLYITTINKKHLNIVFSFDPENSLGERELGRKAGSLDIPVSPLPPPLLPGFWKGVSWFKKRPLSGAYEYPIYQISDLRIAGAE